MRLLVVTIFFRLAYIDLLTTRRLSMLCFMYLKLTKDWFSLALKMPLDASRFRACLLTSLAGDCIGLKFEFSPNVQRDDVIDWVFQHSGGNPDKGRVRRSLGNIFATRPSNVLKYTDDTAMSLDLSTSLLRCQKFDPVDLAKCFGTTCYEDKDIKREWGKNTHDILIELHESGYALNPFELAAKSFEGQGNRRNGASMRVSPVSLFFATDMDSAINVAREQARMTHAHPDAIMGAVLQTTSVYLALHAKPGTLEDDPASFLDEVNAVLDRYSHQVYSDVQGKDWYQNKLRECKGLLEKNSNISDVVSVLGNRSARKQCLATASVPLATFAFVKCLKIDDNLADIQPWQVKNPLVRTLAYTVTLGGDTDTTGCMAGAIAGAYYGERHVPHAWYLNLEGAKKITKRANELYDHCVKASKNN